MSLKASMIIDLAGNLQTRARQNAQSLTGLGRAGQSAMRGLNSAAVKLGQGLDNMAGKTTAMIAGAGVTYKATRAVMDSAQLDKTLARVARTAGASSEQAQDLRNELYRMAQETGQPVENLLQGFYGLVQAGQSWGEALGTIKAINPAMAVTGASADVLASSMTVASQAFKFDLSNAKTATLVLDQMTKAGDLGNAELEDLSGIFARVGNSAKTASLSYAETLAFIERLSLVEKNPERLATLADSTLRLFTNQSYLKTAAKVTGVKFYDAKGERRAAFDVLADIRDGYKNFKTDAERDKAFADAFGNTDLDTQRGLRIYLEGGTIEDARKMAQEIEGASGTIAEGLPKAITNSVDQVARLKSALGKAADEFAQPINEMLSTGIKKVLDEQQIGGKEMLIGGAVGTLAGAALLKVAGKGLSRMGGNIVSNVAKGAGLGGLKIPLPVYIVNKHMSLTKDAMLGKDGAVVPTSSDSGKGPTKVRGARPDVGKRSGRAGGAAAAGFALYDAGRVLMDDEASLADKATGVASAGAEAAGGWGGAALGAKLGATIGTVIAPGIGTAIGAALGGIGGGLAGATSASWLVSAVSDFFKNDKPEAQMQPLRDDIRAMSENFKGAAYNSELLIRVDGNASASVTRNDGFGNIDVYSGTSYSKGIGG